MVETTRLQLPLIAAAQAQKHVTHNEAVLRLDGLAQMTAKSYTTSAQPGSPADGDLYLLPAGKTGTDWGGYSNHGVAHYYDGVWHQYHPSAGWLCWVQDAAALFTYTGSVWSAVPLPNSIADGTATAPGLAFAADTNTGLYRIGADQIGVTTGGTLRRTVSTTAETPTLPQQGQDGTVGAPAYSFSADTDNGLYRIGTNNPGMAAGGSLVQSWSASGTTQPVQPAFSGRVQSSASNVTGDGTAYTVVSYTELYDQGNNFNPSTGIFTAPVTGKYLLTAGVELTNLNSSTFTFAQTVIVTTSQNLLLSLCNPNNAQTIAVAAGLFLFSGTVVAAMSAGDTAKVTAIVHSSTKTVGIGGSSGSDLTYFSGVLLA